jgi:hypothetical protein
VLKVLQFAQLLVPFIFERSSNNAIVGIDGLESALRQARFVACTVQA